MEWDRITPADYSPWTTTGNAYVYAIERSKQRLADNPFVRLIDEQAKWVKSRQDDFAFSLDYQSFLDQEEREKKKTERFKKLNDFQSAISFKALPRDLQLIQKDDILKEKRVRWEESLSKDIYVDEAINVLSDLTEIKRTTTPIAQLKQ